MAAKLMSSASLVAKGERCKRTVALAAGFRSIALAAQYFTISMKFGHWFAPGVLKAGLGGQQRESRLAKRRAGSSLGGADAGSSQKRSIGVIHSLGSNSGGITASSTVRPAESADLPDAKKILRRSRSGNGRLFLQQEELGVKGPERGSQGQRTRGSIDPVLKSWIDNVIVPALWTDGQVRMNRERQHDARLHLRAVFFRPPKPYVHQRPGAEVPRRRQSSRLHRS
ncbi:MAG: hypothetical protein ABSB35_29755 [Bryobacteraceae bacterium]